MSHACVIVYVYCNVLLSCSIKYDYYSKILSFTLRYATPSPTTVMHLVASPLSRYFTCVHELRSNLNTSNRKKKVGSRIEAEFKEKHGIWDPMPELTI
jgi:hypothetical protein